MLSSKGLEDLFCKPFTADVHFDKIYYAIMTC